MREVNGIEAARAFVNQHYQDCLAALLYGSVARSEATSSSDLDIIIVAHHDAPFYRKTLRESGWFIEAFVGSREFHIEKIRRPRANHNPSSLTARAGGIILKDEGDFAKGLKEQAIAILKQGPEPLTEAEVNQYRYIITDWLDDLIDCENSEEELFIAYDLVAKAAELLLAHNLRWIGERKWLYRALEKLDDQLAKQLIDETRQFYRTGEKEGLVQAIESILKLVGGKLYEGYSRVG